MRIGWPFVSGRPVLLSFVVVPMNEARALRSGLYPVHYPGLLDLDLGLRDHLVVVGMAAVTGRNRRG